MVGQIKLFKVVHWSIKDDCINQEAKDGYISLI